MAKQKGYWNQDYRDVVGYDDPVVIEFSDFIWWLEHVLPEMPKDFARMTESSNLYCEITKVKKGLYDCITRKGNWAELFHYFEKYKSLCEEVVEQYKGGDLELIQEDNEYGYSYSPKKEGFSYQDYLRTKHWQKVRREAIQYYGGSCVLCDSTNKLNVHHRNYENLWNEDAQGDLVLLCQSCHEKFHKEKLCQTE